MFVQIKFFLLVVYVVNLYECVCLACVLVIIPVVVPRCCQVDSVRGAVSKQVW